MSTVEAPSAASPSSGTKLTMVDTDVHPYFVNGLDDLAPYLSDAWRHRIGMGIGDGGGGGPTYVNGARMDLPKNEFYRITSGPTRLDTVPPAGGGPGSDPGHVGTQLLDPYDIQRALLIGGPNSGLGSLPDPDVAAALASAYNDWLSDRWLAADERFRGCVLVAPQDPDLAVREIERVADRTGVAGIHLPPYDLPMGERHYHKLYAAAEHHGLPVLSHPAATESIYVKAPRLAYVPTYYLEFHTLLGQPSQSNAASLMVHGVFERFPNLKVVFVESGFAWALDLLWRLQRDWKAQRDEVPWMKRSPTEYLISNIRFTTQPFYEAESPTQIHAVLDAIHAEHTLMFSSDYPHWDFDDPRRALKDLPKEIQERVFAGNAVETFGDRLS